MTNWNKILKDSLSVDIVRTFARGNLSGRQLYSVFTNTEAGGEVRNALRTKGVARTRNAARLALSRRGLDHVDIT